MSDSGPDLSAYSQEELDAARAHGMMLQNGLPSFPPGALKVNSRGEPYSRSLGTMSPQEAATNQTRSASWKAATQRGDVGSLGMPEAPSTLAAPMEALPGVTPSGMFPK